MLLPSSSSSSSSSLALRSDRWWKRGPRRSRGHVPAVRFPDRRAARSGLGTSSGSCVNIPGRLELFNTNSVRPRTKKKKTLLPENQLYLIISINILLLFLIAFYGNTFFFFLYKAIQFCNFFRLQIRRWRCTATNDGTMARKLLPGVQFQPTSNKPNHYVLRLNLSDVCFIGTATVVEITKIVFPSK
jgi:hypothetical protein